MNTSIEDLARNAAKDLLNVHSVERSSSDPLEDFSWELGGQPRQWTYEMGLMALVRGAIELDRQQWDLTEAVAEARDAHRVAALVREPDLQDDLWNNHGPMLDRLQAGRLHPHDTREPGVNMNKPALTGIMRALDDLSAAACSGERDRYLDALDTARTRQASEEQILDAYQWGSARQECGRLRPSRTDDSTTIKKRNRIMTDLKSHMRAITTELDRTTDTGSIDRIQMRIRLVFDMFYDDESDEAIRDALTDLMHAATEHGVDFEEALAAASRMWTSERENWGLDT